MQMVLVLSKNPFKKKPFIVNSSTLDFHFHRQYDVMSAIYVSFTSHLAYVT